MLHFTIVVIYNRRVFKWLVTCHSLESMISHSAKWASVTRLGDYWKFLVTNVLTKVAQIIDDLLGFLKEITFKQKLLGLLYWTTFGWIHNLDYFSLQRLATLANPYLYHHQHQFFSISISEISVLRPLRSFPAGRLPRRRQLLSLPPVHPQRDRPRLCRQDHLQKGGLLKRNRTPVPVSGSSKRGQAHWSDTGKNRLLVKHVLITLGPL